MKGSLGVLKLWMWPRRLKTNKYGAFVYNSSKIDGSSESYYHRYRGGGWILDRYIFKNYARCYNIFDRMSLAIREESLPYTVLFVKIL